MENKPIPFNLLAFQESLDSGNSFALTDSGNPSKPVLFIGFAPTRHGNAIVGVHEGDICQWELNGKFKRDGLDSLLDLQMIPPPPEELSFAEWLNQWFAREGPFLPVEQIDFAFLYKEYFSQKS